VTATLTARFVVTRTLNAVVTIAAAAVLVFAALHAAPGSYEEIILGPTSTPESRAHLAEEFGLDEPLPTQFASWLNAAIHGDFGVSLTTAEPIAAEFSRRAPVTIELTILATLFSLVVGLPLGVVAALRARLPRLAGLSRALGALAMSTPEFVVGSVLVYLFTRYDLGLTIGDYVPFGEDPLANLQVMLLPGMTLGIFASALVMRTTRTAVLAVLSEPYITAAVARGEPPVRILGAHVLRNASIPIITVVGTNLGYLLGGAVIVETLFSLPGFGSFTVSAIELRDYGVVLAGTLIAAAAFVVVNLLVDLSYGLIDRRVLRWQQQ
jgi:peptide/nickel transport system permease protein